MLTKDQVRHVAKLANLSLDDEEVEKYSQQLSNILEYIEQLNEVDTSNIKPTFNVSDNVNVLAEDQIGTSLTQEQALANASVKKDDFFVTKGVFNE